MTSVKWLILMLAVLPAVLAQPATAPATLATPRDAVTALATAMEVANGEQIRQVLYARSRSEEKMVDAMVAMSQAVSRLKGKALEAFGPAGAEELIGDTSALTSEATRQLKSAAEKIAGDVATLTVPDNSTPPVVLKRINDQWRIPISELTKGIPPAEFDQRVAALVAQVAILNLTSDQIAANRFHTGQEAAEYMHKQMLAAAAVPTTNPSNTRPP